MIIKLPEKDKSSIDYWLRHLQKNIATAHKFWKVTTALDSKRNQTGENKFLIPHNKFESARATDYENVQDVLRKLHELNSVLTSYGGRTILDDKNIVSKKNTETEITIIPEQFEYFKDRLMLIVKPELNIPKPFPISSEWQFIDSGKGAVLIYNGKEILKFKSRKYNKYRYFHCLWDNHGLEISCRVMFEYQSNVKYEEQKAKNWQTNQKINHIINKLKKEISNKFKGNELPLTIEIDNSNYKLILTSIRTN